MRSEAPYRNVLSISQQVKSVPYGPAQREDSINHGFQSLKGRPVSVDAIPEVMEDPALAPPLKAINALGSAFFSVGCVSGKVDDESGHRTSGYVEFSLNSIEGIANAANYFPIFFWFQKTLEKNQFDIAVTFDWELQGAGFVDLTPTAHGFTCTIYVNTHYCASREEADENWADSLAFLGHYLGSIPVDRVDYIYPPQP